jgi:hypothetical protein
MAGKFSPIHFLPALCVIASAAKQSRAAERSIGRDCFVAALLAMTA